MNTTPQTKLSKAAAAYTGESFAKSLHAFVTPEMRGLVIDVYNDLINDLTYESRADVQRAYYAKLDELEPLQTMKRA